MTVAMNKIILSAYLFLFIFVPLTEISSEEIIMYDLGNAPEKEIFEVKERNINTLKIISTPFIIKVSRYADEEDKAFLVPGPFGKMTKNIAAVTHYERILFINPLNIKAKNLYLSIEYYYYKYPAKPETFSTSRFRKNNNKEIKVDPIIRFYNAKIYKLKTIKPSSKTIIDTPGNRIYLGGSKKKAEEIIVLNKDGSTHTIKAIKEYAGYILSIFSENKLINQITNNQKLRKNGFSKLTEKLLDKHLVE